MKTLPVKVVGVPLLLITLNHNLLTLTVVSVQLAGLKYEGVSKGVDGATTMDRQNTCEQARAERNPIMQQAFASVWRYAWVRVVLTLFLAYIGGTFIVQTSHVWFLALAAFLTAYLAHPLLSWTRRRFHAEWLGLLLFFLALLVILALIASLLYGLVEQAVQFTRTLPGLVRAVTGDAADVPQLIRNLPIPERYQPDLVNAYRSAVGQLGNVTTGILDGLESYIVGGGLIGSITTITNSVIDLVALLALTVYILLSLPEVTRFLLRMFPKPYQPTTRDVVRKFEHAVGGYFRGQLAIASCVGVMVGLGLWLLGVPLALSLGFLAGVFNLIPYLGVIVSTIPALILAASVGGWQVLGVLGVVAAANQLEAHVLSPLILGRTTELHPAAIIIAILIGASLGSIWGALVSVPLVAFLKLLYEDYYQTSRFYEKG